MGWNGSGHKIEGKYHKRMAPGFFAVSAAEEEVAVIVRSRLESEVALFSCFPCAAAQDGVATKVLAAVAAGSPPPPASAACERSSRGNYYWGFSLTSIGSGARWFWQVKVSLLRACVPSQRDRGE